MAYLFWPKFIAQWFLAILHRVRGHAFRINPVALRTLKRADYESSPIWRDTRKHSPYVAALTCWPTDSFKSHGVPRRGNLRPFAAKEVNFGLSKSLSGTGQTS